MSAPTGQANRRRTRSTSPAALAALLAVASIAMGAMVAFSPNLTVLLFLVAACVAVVYLVRDDLTLLHILVAGVFLDGLAFGPLSVGRAVAAGAVLFMLFGWLSGRWTPPPTRAQAWAPPMALFVWSLASGLWSEQFGAWAFFMGQLGLAAAYFAAFALLTSSTRDIDKLLVTYSALAIVAGIYGGAQFLLLGNRATGFQGDWNIYSLTETMAIPTVWMLSQNGGRSRLWLLGLPVLFGAVLASGSRGGLLAVVGVLFGMLVMHERRATGPRMVPRMVTAVSLVVLAALASLSNERLNAAYILADRGSGRFDIWFVAFRTAMEHPIMGVGGGGFAPISLDLLRYEPGVELIKSHLLYTSGVQVHNQYLGMWVELGLVGLALFVLVLFVAYRLTWKACRALGDPPFFDALIPMLLGFVVGVIFLSIPNNKVLWILVGFSVALDRIALHRAAARVP